MASGNPSSSCSAELGRLSREPRLAGKVAVVTGASRGFGQAIAVRFAEEGARLALCSRGGCKETVGRIAAIRGVGADRVSDMALDVRCDISDEESVKRMFREVEAKFGPSSYPQTDDTHSSLTITLALRLLMYKAPRHPFESAD